ncbi:hypothetical protein SAMN05421594_1110 [Chryseobacterium oleae]|uniref:Dolichyl-phosphate-mannose-protein mannosyltransferase n=2 Tax=Chryseobacterium oleae TaxID=491207 RepID=A0A1I4WEW8_CHROL|nr:hypothetical protein SAMN05421594_1110 [Chryseobacterium oleae]
MLLLSALYIIFICIYSIDLFDLGFIPSMIGRLQEGQIIYKDFDYIRPFLGLVFWDYLLKFIPGTTSYFILITRLLVVIQSLIIAVFIQKIIFDKVRCDVSLLLLICFLGTFSILPWHTIDGIFFGTISLYFYKKKWIFSALIFLAFACLTKQSFFIFGLGIFMMIVKDFYKKVPFHKKDIIIFIFSVIFLLFVVYHYQIVKNFHLFLNQVFNFSMTSGFYENGIAPYLFKIKLNNVLFFYFLVLLYFLDIKKKYAEVGVLIIFIGLIIYPFFNNGVYKGVHSVFLLVVILFVKYDFQNKFIFFLLFLGWSASISWGANSPFFFMFIMLYKFIDRSKLVFPMYIICLGVFSLYRLLYPYQSKSIFSSTHVFTKKLPTVSGLLISENEYQYLSEAKMIRSEYENIIFLPGSPILDVIYKNYINRASWEMDVEYPSWRKDFFKLKDSVFAIDNEQIKVYNKGFYKSSFTVEITKTRKIIKKNKFFTIYGPVN